MSITRANVESILVRRVGTWLTAAGLDGTTVNGTNADLNDPIAQALLGAGYTVASVVAVADADLDDVTAADTPLVLDLAELRTLETVAQAFTTLDVSGLGYAIKTNNRIDQIIAQKRAAIAQRYGVGSGGMLTGGTLTLSFAETDSSA